MERYIIQRNDFLSINIQAYFNTYYVGYKRPGNPDFLNELKNTFNDKPSIDLKKAMEPIYDRFVEDIPKIIQENQFDECVLVSVPRSKAYSMYSNNQLLFNETIKNSFSAICKKVPFCKLFDGSEWITRIKNTKTTHIRKEISGFNNDGNLPYPGITKDTCVYNSAIKGKDIILIDDIYTATVNIDEDCIQALLDWGAKSVVFYSIGYTKRQ